MRILFVTKGNRNLPSSRVRAIQYFPYLISKGISIKHIIYRSGIYLRYSNKLKNKTILEQLALKSLIIILKVYDYLLFSNIKILTILFSYKKFDAIFLQKIVLPAALLRRIAKHCTVIFDFDDAIYLTNKLLSIKQFNSQISLSDLVTVANNDALKYVRSIVNTKCGIINGPIDIKRYLPTKPVKKDKLILGWIGSFSSVHYLDILKKPLSLIEKKYPGIISAIIIGDPDYNFKEIPTKSYPWTEDSENVLLSQIDIGIMPLYDDDFSKGKGGYKLLQYMAAGKPNISSDVGINSTIVEDKDSGFIVRSEQDWYNAIESYIKKPELLKKHGTRSREIVVEKYSLEAWADYYISFLIANEKDG